jgi:hypothetical protein
VERMIELQRSGEDDREIEEEMERTEENKVDREDG